MIDHKDVTNWLDSYKVAWETQNPEAIVALFTDDGAYFETPYLVHSGHKEIHQYWLEAPGGQSDIRFQYQILSVLKLSAIAHWSAQFQRVEQEMNLDGIFLLNFSDDKRCKVLREWWHAKGDCQPSNPSSF